jgi:ribosome-associated toxin RatA of RatAB toxin-antitoxin module
MLSALLYLAIGVIGLIVLAAVVLYLLGTRIPVEHMASSEIEVPVSAAAAYEVVSDIESHPTWAKGTTGVLLLPERNGMQVARVSMGRNTFVLTRTRHEPGRMLERTIDDVNGPFSGSWRYEFKDVAGGGSTVRLTEVGRIKSPVPRAVMKYFFGYHMYVNIHLKSLGERLKSRAEPRKMG